MRFFPLFLAAAVGWAAYTLYRQDRRFAGSLERMRARAEREEPPAPDVGEVVAHALEQPHPETPVARALEAAVTDRKP